MLANGDVLAAGAEDARVIGRYPALLPGLRLMATVDQADRTTLWLGHSQGLFTQAVPLDGDCLSDE